MRPLNTKLSSDGRYDESIAATLFPEIKILCMVVTHPENHKNASKKEFS
jgi:hypothetical protein